MADVIDNNAKQPTGSGFTNLSKVLGANQSNQLGSSISSGIGNTIGQANNTLGQEQQQFGQQSQAGTVGSAQDKAYEQNTLQNPSQATQSDYDKFSRYRQGYTGPSGLQDQGLQAQQQDIKSLGNLTSNAPGQQALLQRFIGSPQYTQGQQQLDTLLLGQSGGPALQQARRAALQANQNIGSAQDIAQQQAQLLGNQSQNFANQVGTDITNAGQQQVTNLTNTAQQNTAQQQALRDVLANLFTPVQNGQATPTGGTSVGAGFAGSGTKTGPSNITQDQYNQAVAALQSAGPAGQQLLQQQFYGANTLQGFDPNSIIGNQATVNPYTLNQVATAQDQSNAKALQQLSGQPGMTFGSFDPNAAVGGYNPLAFINQGNLTNYENQGQQQYNQAQNTIKSGQQYQADINSVKDLASQEGNLLNQVGQRAQAQGIATGSADPFSLMTADEKAQYDNLQNQRTGLVNKQSLTSLNPQLANYMPTGYFSNPTDAAYNSSMFNQGVATGLGNATNDINRETPITQQYAPTTINQWLQNLMNPQGQVQS